MTDEKLDTTTLTPDPVFNLPSWTDPASVASYLISVATFVIGVLAEFHVGVPASFTGNEAAIAGSVSIIVSGVVQLFNIVTHRSTTAKIITALTQVPAGARKTTK